LLPKSQLNRELLLSKQNLPEQRTQSEELLLRLNSRLPRKLLPSRKLLKELTQQREKPSKLNF
jgi:hypothetical protein